MSKSAKSTKYIMGAASVFAAVLWLVTMVVLRPGVQVALQFTAGLAAMMVIVSSLMQWAFHEISGRVCIAGCAMGALFMLYAGLRLRYPDGLGNVEFVLSLAMLVAIAVAIRVGKEQQNGLDGGVHPDK